MKDKIIFISLEKRSNLKINKSRYGISKRRLKVGKQLKFYNKTKVKIEWMMNLEI
jgi:hypothetical protein